MARVHDDGVFEAHLVGPSIGHVRLSPAGHRPTTATSPWSTIPIATAPSSASSTATCGAKARTSAPTRPSAPGRSATAPTDGVQFAVWAPNAQRVSVVGDFNGWDPRVHPMRLLADAGRLGDLRARPRARPALQVRPARRPRPPRPQGRSVRALVRGAARHRLDRLARRLRLGRRRVDGAPRRHAGDRRRADVDLRGAPRIVAPRRPRPRGP